MTTCTCLWRPRRRALTALGAILVLLAPVPAASADSSAPAGESRAVLRGILVVPDLAASVAAIPPGFSGLDVSRVAELQNQTVAKAIQPLLGAPLEPSLPAKITSILRLALAAQGKPFYIVNVPPQEISEGVIRVIVQRAKLDGELRIEGAEYFSEASYRALVPAFPGGEIDAAALQEAVARLNHSPYRRAVLAAEPGGENGTTKLTLRVQETRPWNISVGYSNSGTAVTDENRLSAGVMWGNAFGRGDTLGYNFSADPEFKHSLSHSANYGTTFKSGRSLSAFGAYATIESALPEPLTQEGTSWQVGTRFGVPLVKTDGGWERSLSFAADFKYSDNNLEFATIPITNNATHVAQLGATFVVSRRAKEGKASFSASLYASPGGLTNHNDDEAFEVSRPGAKAAYVYGRMEGQYSRPLPRGFSWSASASLQLASGSLLGTEQLNGAGSGGVRGYRESSAFGDEGMLVNTELHLPAFPLSKGRDQVDLFAFVDAATLRDLGPAANTTELAATGLGVNYRFGGHFSLGASYGWSLKAIPDLADQGAGQGHINASFRF
jgi:hemolysin activation/secretion protein